MTSRLSKTRWMQIDQILDHVLELPSAEQLAVIKNKCKNDKALFKEVRTLLDLERNAPEFLSQPAFNIIDTTIADMEVSDDTSGTHPGSSKHSIHLNDQQIGPYRLCEKIGEGGMGVVYRAERTEGNFHQQVAIKLLSSEKTKQIEYERFEREQQLLASLVHPNIARLYDGGVSSRGQPYYVMEYIAGTPIDRYCHDKQLSIHEKLQLICNIAKTLQFAHSHLIIHRDIKPSNILITQEGDIKLLDFGIAKLIDDQHLHKLTLTGEQLLTPGAAAPEQLKNHAVTVATDIYQLGLLGYELLSGVKPYQETATSFIDFMRRVCEEPALAPSIALKRSQKLNTQAAKYLRKAAKDSWESATRLQQALRGDIDAIILKMLHIEPKNRYTSMEALAQDILAYFQNRPIKAQKITPWYRIQKFIKRNWRACALAAFFIVTGAAYIFEINYQTHRAEAALAASVVEQKKASAVSEFLTSVFKAADPYQVGAEKVSARQLLDQGQARAEKELESLPEIKGYMLQTLGEINHTLGEHRIALSLLERALQNNREHLAFNDPTIAENLSHLADVHESLDNNEKAKQLFLEALAIYSHVDYENKKYGSMRSHILNELGVVQLKLGEVALAQKNWETVIHSFEQKNITVHRELAIALNNLSILHHRGGNFDLAVNAMRKAIAINETLLGSEHPQIALSLRNLGVKMVDWEGLGDAETLLTRAFNLQKNALMSDHPEVLKTQRQLAYLYHKQGRLREAETLLNDTYRIQNNEPGRQNVDSAMTLYRLAEVQRDLSKYHQAENSYSEMINIYHATKAGSSTLGRGIAGQAMLALTMNDLTRAENLFAQALELLPKKSMRTSMTRLGLAQLLLKKDQGQAALKLAKEVLEFRRQKLPENHNLINEAKIVMAIALMKVSEKNDAANALLKSSFHKLAKGRSRHDRFLTLAQTHLKAP